MHPYWPELPHLTAVMVVVGPQAIRAVAIFLNEILLEAFKGVETELPSLDTIANFRDQIAYI